jgi:hypothetical protein
MTLMKARFYLLPILLLALALSAPVAAQTYTTIDYPGAVATLAVEESCCWWEC